MANELQRMDLDKAWPSLQLCEFNDGECSFCEIVLPEMFYVRTCWEVEEGDYYCRQCAEQEVAQWEVDEVYYDELAKEQKSLGCPFYDVVTA